MKMKLKDALKIAIEKQCPGRLNNFNFEPLCDTPPGCAYSPYWKNRYEKT